MIDHDEVSPNGSNGSSPTDNVETGNGYLEIDGEKFEYRETTDEVEVFVPEDYPEEKRPALERKVDEFKQTLASTKRKAFEVNREKDEVAEERRRLAEEREALRREREQLSAQRTTSAPQDNALRDAFGVETWDDVAVLQVENPQAYHQGFARYNAGIAAQDAYERVRSESIQQTIRAEGFNPQTVAAFAKANGINRLDVAYDYYKRVNEKPKGQSLADIQKKTVKFVPKGAGTSQTPKIAPGMKKVLDETP